MEDLTKAQLNKVARDYNVHVLIKGISKLKKADLIKEMKKHLHYDKSRKVFMRKSPLVKQGPKKVDARERINEIRQNVAHKKAQANDRKAKTAQPQKVKSRPKSKKQVTKPVKKPVKKPGMSQSEFVKRGKEMEKQEQQVRRAEKKATDAANLLKEIQKKTKDRRNKRTY